jgi:hypothetical protein
MGWTRKKYDQLQRRPLTLFSGELGDRIEPRLIATAQ